MWRPKSPMIPACWCFPASLAPRRSWTAPSWSIPTIRTKSPKPCTRPLPCPARTGKHVGAPCGRPFGATPLAHGRPDFSLNLSIRRHMRHDVCRSSRRAGACVRCRTIYVTFVATAYRRLAGTGIAAVSEEASGILSGDAVESGSERLLQRLDGARGDPAQIGFPLGPARLDRAEVGAVAGQVTIGQA